VLYWDPSLRRVLGLVYVDLFLASNAFLLRRLLLPYRTELLAAAKHFDEVEYYSGSEVREAISGRLLHLSQVPLDGTLVLEGETALGKTMFLKHIVSYPGAIAILLPATDCDSGVIAAICNRFPADEKFVNAIAMSGRLQICIDDLDKAPAKATQEIDRFIRTRPHAKVALALQDLTTWTPPATARVYTIQPLSDQAIREFLLSREPFLPTDASVRGTEYRDECQRILDQMLGPHQVREVLDERRRVLSKPQALASAAEMIGRKQDFELAALSSHPGTEDL
jgi:hypothetical protein